MRYKSLQDNWSSKGLLTASETSYKGLEDLAQNNQLQQITLLINFQKYWWWLNKQGNHNANLAWKCKFGQGFAKSRPAAQRPAAHGPRRPSGPAAWRPSGPRPGGPVLSSPSSSPDFPQFFCPAVNPCSCTDLHRVWACKMDDGEFEFVYHFNHLNPCFCLLHVVQIRTFSFSVHSSLYRNR